MAYKALPALCAAAIGALGFTSPATANSADEFYKGKQVTMVVGFSAGGGYDQYARVLARYMGEHIPGKPNLIVQNMPGAGSLTSVRYLDATAPKDGTTITAFNPGVITDAVLDPDKVKVKMSEFNYLGSITRDFRACYAWKASGIKGLADMQGGREFIMGATGPGTSNYINGAMMKNLLGFNVKQVLGFPGSNEQRIAVERGELNGDCGSWSSVPEDWIKGDKIVPIVSFSPGRTPDMPVIPFARDLIKDSEKLAVLDMLIAAGEIGRPFIVSKAVPAERVAVLRAAFDKTMTDPGFVEETKKMALPVYPMGGAEAQKIVEKIYTTPADIIAKAKKAVE